MHQPSWYSPVPVPWTQTPETITTHYHSDVELGLTTDQVLERAREQGKNEVISTKRITSLQIFLRQFTSPLIFILLFAVAATLVMQEWVDAMIIMMAILVNAGLGFYQESRAEHAVEELKSFIRVRTRVIRDGREQEIDARELVVGDIVHVTLGSRVPADGRLILEYGLKVDEAILTGESLPVEKDASLLTGEVVLGERSNMLFGGTLVTEGSGRMIVTAIGMQTEFGQIASLVEGTEREETPLQKAVKKLAWIIAVTISIFVLGVFLLGVSRGESIFEMLLISIAVAVGAIPEALPIGLTAVLAVGVERLAKRKGIMRSLTAAETLGSTTVVMTDKTGTLTEAKLQLQQVLTTSRLLVGDTSTKGLTDEERDVLYMALMATDVVVESREGAMKDWQFIGNPVEVAIVRQAATEGLAITDTQKSTVIIPFSSAHKFSVYNTPLRLRTELTGSRFGNACIVVGAPDILLARSALSKTDYLQLTQSVTGLSESGNRLVGVAVMYLSEGAVPPTTPEEVADITFVGVVAFVDPVRPEVPAAIKKIEQFGVRVIMATGDLPGTAAAIARQLGWDVRPEEILTGEMLTTLGDEDLKELLRTTKICARVTPADKLRVARLLQSQGEVVAMTGDGVNDAPSLKAVDIGIAVGSGSDVAKGVADLILLDDNFHTIVAAIEEGKRVLRNIRKTFVYLMSNSLDEIFLIGGSLLVGIALPLTAMQIIWVNFFTGSLPAVAFAFDVDMDEERGRQNGPEKIINATAKGLTIIVGVVTSLLLFIMYYTLTLQAIPLAEVQTFIFVCFAAYILLVSFSFRNLSKPIWSYNPFSNRVLNIGVVIGLTLTVATIYVPLLQGIFSTVALSLVWWGGVIVWLIFAVLFVELIKWSMKSFN
jgi:Ca2+-transporting ATPase